MRDSNHLQNTAPGVQGAMPALSPMCQKVTVARVVATQVYQEEMLFTGFLCQEV
jgi:hypothetical protein